LFVVVCIHYLFIFEVHPCEDSKSERKAIFNYEKGVEYGDVWFFSREKQTNVKALKRSNCWRALKENKDYISFQCSCDYN